MKHRTRSHTPTLPRKECPKYSDLFDLFFTATSENKKGKTASAPVTRPRLNRSLTGGVRKGKEPVLPDGLMSEQDELSAPGKWAKEAIVKAAEKKEALQIALLDMYQNG